MNTNIKAVLFDLDGTLIDTERIYRVVWPKTLEHFGYEMAPWQVLKLRSLGRPYAPAQFKEWYGEDFDYAKAREYRKGLFEEVISKEGIQIKEGAEDILKYLKNNNILCSTATATDEERAKRYLEKVGLYKYFDKLCCATQVEFGKPSPDLYEFAVKELGLSKEECIAVEDATNGVKSAHDAGLKVVYIPDYHDDEEEVGGLYYKKAQKLMDLVPIIESL